MNNKSLNREAVQALSDYLTQLGYETIQTDDTQDGFSCDFFCTQGTLSTDDFPKLTAALPKYSFLSSISGLHLAKPAQRISGKTFETQAQLEEFLRLDEELKQFDHRYLGPTLGIFRLEPELTPGMITWLPNGVIVLEKIKSIIRQVMKTYNYQEIITPYLAHLDLWKRSGHWEMYQENMFTVKSGQENAHYALKPMSCPLHVDLFKSEIRSYKMLPYKLSEFGCCSRYESSGSLHGLFRTRGFTQDDAHVFCTEEQIPNVITDFIQILKKIYRIFGFTEIKCYLSTRPEKFAGTQEKWQQAETELEKAAHSVGLDLSVKPGDGAFYGPKLDFCIQDNRNRTWQCGTVQLDFVLPERLGAQYINSQNEKVVPVMVHHAVLGSLERFLGVLLEQTKGRLPFWLSPVQIIIIPVSSHQVQYCTDFQSLIVAKGFSCKVDDSSDTMSAKIKRCMNDKIPIICVLGQRETLNGEVTVRMGGQEESLTNQEFFAKISEMGRIFE